MNTHHYKAAFVNGIRCTCVVLSKVNLHYTFCRRASSISCRYATSWHLFTYTWRKNAGRASRIASTASSTGMINLIFFQSVVISVALSRHFNFVTRLLLSLQSFLQFCAVFASCNLIELASFLKSTNCILNNPLPIVWWQ